MQTETFVISSKYDGLALHGIVITPNTQPRGIIQILHGMCEYKERYQDFMRFFVEHGYIAVCHDQRGHGDSIKTQEDRGYFYDEKAKAIVDDAAQITCHIKEKYPNLPVALFGHSMGSMVARCYLQRYDTLIDRAIICGSPSKNGLVNAGIFTAKALSFFRGERFRSKRLAYLATGKGNKRFVGESYGCWLSRNRESIEEFYNNPKGRFTFTCNGFVNLFRLMKYTYDKKRYRVQNPTLPILFVSGSDDAVLRGQKRWEKSVDVLRKVGYQNVSSKLYDGLRHEIFHDIGGEKVLQDILAFLFA